MNERKIAQSANAVPLEETEVSRKDGALLMDRLSQDMDRILDVVDWEVKIEEAVFGTEESTAGDLLDKLRALNRLLSEISADCGQFLDSGLKVPPTASVSRGRKEGCREGF